MRNMTELGPIDLDDPKAWDLAIKPQERVAALAALGVLASERRIAINMGGKDAQKDWGAENWRMLMDRLAISHPGYGLFAVGAAQDGKRADEIGQRWPGEFRNLCGIVSPRQSAAALEGAVLFIGHDSGPLHLASAVGVRCVGLYGDFNRPRTWHPYLGRHEILHDMRGVTQITVEQVMKAAASILDSPA